MATVPSTCFLSISGIVSHNKKKEFEQTAKFIFNQLPHECIQQNLATDIYNEQRYFFLSTWLSEQSLIQFLQSEEYRLFKGAYDVLGHLDNLVYGTIV
jgi:quinol monooxygenase YgiN